MVDTGCALLRTLYARTRKWSFRKLSHSINKGFRATTKGSSHFSCWHVSGRPLLSLVMSNIVRLMWPIHNHILSSIKCAKCKCWTLHKTLIVNFDRRIFAEGYAVFSVNKIQQNHLMNVAVRIKWLGATNETISKPTLNIILLHNYSVIITVIESL